MIVKVIVDIPARQVNRTFDYLVPAAWKQVVSIGQRIQVPFGNIERMAFIIEIDDQSDYSGSLKEISGIIDYESFLNQELIDLSAHLAETLFSFRISILQAMLPSMLRAKYERILLIKSREALNAFLEINYQGPLEVNLSEFVVALTPPQIHQLRHAGIIALEYRVINQVTQKTEKYFRKTLSQEDYRAIISTLSSRSHKQRMALDFLANHWPEAEISKHDLLAAVQLSNTSLKQLVEKGWLAEFTKAVYRSPLQAWAIPANPLKQLTPEQSQVVESITASMAAKEAKTFLLEGVTGSGKTEVYLQIIAKAHAAGQSALLLVPEIALTPQMIERVVGRFREGVAVLHSGLSESEKYDEWLRIIRGAASIIVGARSSVFAPLANLGVIIIDEEHEGTYKQADNPRYHARDVALWRSHYHQIPLILGSATPSLESRSRAEVGKYQLLELKQRANQQALPQIEIIDMTQNRPVKGQIELSQALIAKISQRLDAQQQIILLLNRRGYANYVLCRECGYVMHCPHCDISLTYHKYDNWMKCHYCNYQELKPDKCPQCHSEHFHPQGSGTQKVAEILKNLWPEVQVTRMDNDTTRRKGQHQKLLAEFASGRSQILLGTQMIAKGLDFANVTLVGVINADTALNVPDFRAGERTYQLLSQVSGRAGRGALAGEVIIQTYNPDHYIMQFVQTHDYYQFFLHEMKRRHITNYPPYYFTTLIKVSSKRAEVASQKAYEIKVAIQQALTPNKSEVIMVGPNLNNLRKLKDYYQVNILLKYKKVDLIRQQLLEILDQSQKAAKSGVFISIDHEPQIIL